MIQSAQVKTEGARGFCGGPVVKSLACSAGDTGSIPGPGRSPTPWRTAGRPVWHNCRAHRLQLTPGRPRVQGSLHTAVREWPPLAATRESPCTATKTPGSQEINTVMKNFRNRI